MKRKCRVCLKGNINADGTCEQCGAVEYKSQDKKALNPFYGRCELCGGEGRKIEHGEGRQMMIMYRCYDCWCKEFNKERVNRAITYDCPLPVMSYSHKKYQAYLMALNEHFHKPRFYNRQPNWILIKQASLELQKTEVSIDQRKVIEAYQNKQMADIIFKAG